MKQKKALEMPSTEQFETLVARDKEKSRVRQLLRRSVAALVTIAAVAVLVSTLWLPVFQISNNAMEPLLEEGQLVVAVKNIPVEKGDVIAFYYNNKILVKRIIASSGDYISVDQDGVVTVNDVRLEEDYVKDLALGQCDIEMPYHVPESRYFVMGDHRVVSVDSRHTTVGCVSEEQIVGKLVFRLWPFDDFGALGSERPAQ